MIILGLALLGFGLFTTFLSVDPLDFALSLMRVVLSCLVIFYAKFQEQGLLETAVLIFGTLLLTLFGMMRKEVQSRHDES